MPGPLRTIELRASPGRWRVSSAPPAPSLTGLVQEYWEVEGRLHPFREKVLPSGWVELMVSLGPVHRTLTEAGPHVWKVAWLAGLRDRALLIESLEGTHLVSARLHPLGARSLLGGDAPHTANTVIDLDALLGSEAEVLRERLLAAGCPGVRFSILEGFLQRRLLGQAAKALVRSAVGRIEAAHGNLRIAYLHHELGVSRKHLALVFASELGVTPKVYARIQRFSWVLAQIQDASRVNWSQLAADAGYSDQAHLIRDFQNVASSSPTEFLRARTRDGTTLLTEPR